MERSTAPIMSLTMSIKCRLAATGTTDVLETIMGEAGLLRGMAYFKLISMWGDVPYFTNVVSENQEVSDLARTTHRPGKRFHPGRFYLCL